MCVSVDTLCCPHRCLIMWIWRGEKREKLYMLDECSTKQYVCICSLINQKLYALIDEKFGSPYQNEFTATKKPAMREVRISFFFEEWMLPLPNWNCENILGKLEWTYEKKKKTVAYQEKFLFQKKTRNNEESLLLLWSLHITVYCYGIIKMKFRCVRAVAYSGIGNRMKAEKVGKK